MKNKDKPVQVLLDNTRVYDIDAKEKRYIKVYIDPDKKLKPKLLTRAEFHALGGIIGLYHDRGHITPAVDKFGMSKLLPFKKY
jgi:hypothetical protein